MGGRINPVGGQQQQYSPARLPLAKRGRNQLTIGFVREGYWAIAEMDREKQQKQGLFGNQNNISWSKNVLYYSYSPTSHPPFDGWRRRKEEVKQLTEKCAACNGQGRVPNPNPPGGGGLF